MSDLFVYHAEICKTFANPRRLEIIDSLRDGAELTASALLGKMAISKSNLSQHMAVLVQEGIVVQRREGISVYYKLSDKRITKACDLMREVLIDKLSKQSALLETFEKKGAQK